MDCIFLLRSRYMWILSILIVLILQVSLVNAATFITKDGEVVIEAENYTRLAGSIGGQWSFKTDWPGYRGSGFVQSADDDPNTLTFRIHTIAVQYDIDFREAGTYYIHLRTLAEDHAQNGFFASIDGVEVDYGHVDADYIYVEKHEANPNWWWYTDGGGADGRGYLVRFTIDTPGEKTLAIYRRDKNSRIDRIWLTQDDSPPRNTGTLSLPDPNTFIVTQDPEICNDGLDNNSNGATDCDDAQCVDYAGCYPEGNCGDGEDDDLDGQIDCDDSDCVDYAGCNPESNCDDGEDDDLDGQIDCADTDCAAYVKCIPESNCGDGEDDDLDGQIDCDDTDCAAYGGCNPESSCDNDVDDDFDGLTDCDDSDCSERDSDNDGVTDCQDLFPQNPDETVDADSDGTGDNADEDDDNDTVPDSEETGKDGDKADYDGDGDGQPDSKQNSVASLHSDSGTTYLTLKLPDQVTFSRLTTANVKDLTSAPEGAQLGYDLFDIEVAVGENGAAAKMTLHLPEGAIVDTVMMYGPTPNDTQNHWFRFDYNGKTGAQIDGNLVTLHFVDGLKGDFDLTGNGTVKTLMGPARLVENDDGTDATDKNATKNSSSGGGGGGGCFIGILK